MGLLLETENDVHRVECSIACGSDGGRFPISGIVEIKMNG